MWEMVPHLKQIGTKRLVEKLFGNGEKKKKKKPLTHIIVKPEHSLLCFRIEI